MKNIDRSIRKRHNGITSYSCFYRIIIINLKAEKNINLELEFNGYNYFKIYLRKGEESLWFVIEVFFIRIYL